MIFAIPSYNRACACNYKTLKTLQEHNIPRKWIHVFVVEEDLEEYTRVLDKNLYGKIIVGKKGIAAQREFIDSYFEPGQHIVSIDDDITEIDISLTNHKTILDFVKSAFAECELNDTWMWGVYPVYNKFFRENIKEETQTNLCFIIGSFYGYINRPKNEYLRIPTHIQVKEDVLRSIKYYLHDGKLLRYNKVATKQNFYSKGGLGGLKERINVSKVAAQYIHNEYPQFTKIKTRKNGLQEIVLCANPARNYVISNNDIPIVLPEIDPAELYELYDILENTKIPIQRNLSGRARTFGTYSGVLLGKIKPRVKKEYQDTKFTITNPELHEAIIELGKKICPFHFETIQLNHNVVCPPHRDSGNEGNSIIISFGDYEGGNLCIEKHGEYNTNCRPLLFNGKKHLHWNTPILSGNKYSLVYFYRPQ